MIGIIYAALPTCEQTEKTTEKLDFSISIVFNNIKNDSQYFQKKNEIKNVKTTRDILICLLNLDFG